MNIESVSLHGFMVYRISNDLDIFSDLENMTRMVVEGIAGGQINFAFSFSPGSSMSSRILSVLIQCYKKVDKAGGKLAIVQPNKKMLKALRGLPFSRLVTVCGSENDLQSLA
jgi:anti-anti-sigma factor